MKGVVLIDVGGRVRRVRVVSCGDCQKCTSVLGLVQVARTRNAAVRSSRLTGRVVVTIISGVVAGRGVIVTRPLVAAVVITALITSINVAVRSRARESNETRGGADAGYGLRLNEVEALSIR